MAQSEDVGRTSLLDFEAWRALLRSNYGGALEVTSGAYGGQDSRDGAVRAGTGKSASLARDVQLRTS